MSKSYWYQAAQQFYLSIHLNPLHWSLYRYAYRTKPGFVVSLGLGPISFSFTSPRAIRESELALNAALDALSSAFSTGEVQVNRSSGTDITTNLH